MTDHEQWLADRKRGIGGSDAAAVCGVDPYRSAYQLWAEKCGLIEPDDLSENEAVEWGVRLEPTILAAFVEHTGRVVSRWNCNVSLASPRYPWMRATPDGIQDCDERADSGLVQIKTCSAWKNEEWRDGPPLHYEVQVQHEMAVFNRKWASLVVLIGGQRLRYFDVERDDKFISALIEREREFWACVEARTPPAIDGSYSTARTLARLHPDDNGSTVEVSSDVARWFRIRDECKAKIKDEESAIVEAENHIKAAVGRATYAVTPDGERWSYKTQERAEHVCKASKFRVLRRVKT